MFATGAGATVFVQIFLAVALDLVVVFRLEPFAVLSLFVYRQGDVDAAAICVVANAGAILQVRGLVGTPFVALLPFLYGKVGTGIGFRVGYRKGVGIVVARISGKNVCRHTRDDKGADGKF